MQGGNRPEAYAGHGTHGKSADGNGTGGHRMGAAKDDAAGKRNPQIIAEGGENVTGAQLDAIKDATYMATWEALNKDDPKAQKAVELLKLAIDLLERVEQVVADAAEAVENTPEQWRVESLNVDADELVSALRMQIERMK
jgi:hypothetical protein